MKKKYVSAMVLAALLGAQCYMGGVEAEKVSYDLIGTKPFGEIILHGDVDEDQDLSNIKYGQAMGVSGTVYGVLATDGATLHSDNENINISASSTSPNLYVTAVGADIVKNGNMYTDGGTVYLGKAGVTKNISLTATSSSKDAVGLSAIRNPSDSNKDGAAPSKIEVNGDNLIVNAQSQSGMAVGIWVQNNTGNPENPSKVVINAENTQMNLSSEDGETAGIVAYSGGHVDINSNLRIDADNVILTRGNSEININEDGTHSTQLTGDVTFDYDQDTSGTGINSAVNINLSGENSMWIGNTKANWTATTTKPGEDKMKVTDFHLSLQDGAQWTVNTVNEEEVYNSTSGPKMSGSSYVAADEVTLNGGIINITGAKEQKPAESGSTVHTGVTIEKLNGTGGTVNLEAADDFSTRELSILSADGNGEASTQLAVNFTGINADDISTDKATQQKQMNTLAGNIKFGTGGTGIDGKKLTATTTVGEGLINGGISAVMDTDTGGTDSIKLENIKQDSSTTTMDNMRDIAAVSIAAWRQEDSTLSQRLGDLRESKEGQGIWARMNRGEFEYSGAFKNQYNYFQIGYDMAKGDWHYGAAVSHTDGETSYANGYGENDSTSLSLYGTRLMNDGQYLDLVLKVGRLSNEFDNYATAGHTHGDYDAWGTAISGEYGKKLDLKEGWFVTPQAQLSLMRIGGEDYTTSNKNAVSQDTLYSAVGRVGFEAGKDTGWGSFYAKASVLHEFAGDADTYVRLDDRSNSYSQDLGDTWYEAGFGFNWKMGNGSYFYADVIRTFGGDIDTPWQWNAGVRWGF